MFTSLQFLIIWPSQETVRMNIPSIFKYPFPCTRCIIDYSEARAQTYKKHKTIKFLIGIITNGVVFFLSKYWGERATDKHITHNSGFLDNIEHDDIILVDRGFDIADDIGVQSARLEIPSFMKGKANRRS